MALVLAVRDYWQMTDCPLYAAQLRRDLTLIVERGMQVGLDCKRSADID